MPGAAEILAARLAAIRDAGRHRVLAPASGVDLCSNDYLGFARDPALAAAFAAALDGLPNGAGAARLLRGDLAIHARAETALAALSGRAAALLFPSGYQANVALLTALLDEGDTVYTDALNHASIADGIRLSRAARVVYPHADAGALRRLILRREAGGAGGLRLIVTESLFSMDGDLAPLAALAGLAEEHGALLVVDEAHATGLFGPGGGGLVRAMGLERSVFATVHTGGKALGAAGAWVAGEEPLRDLLVNRARAFMFSTAPLPALALLLERAAAHLGAVGAERAGTVRRRARRLKTLLREAGIAAGVAGRGPAPSGTAAPAPIGTAGPAPDGDAAAEAAAAPIVPIVLGGNERALAVAAALRERGFDARAVRPPTVPRGTARLRITVTWGVDDDALAAFVTALSEALRAAETLPAAERPRAAGAPRDGEARS